MPQPENHSGVSEIRLKTEARRLGLLSYRLFRTRFEATARRLGLGTLTIHRRSYERWLAGNTRTLPRPDTRRVLEEIFELPVRDLFTAGDGPAAIDVSPRPDGRSPRPIWDGTPQGVLELMHMAAEEARADACAAERAVGPSGLALLEEDVRGLAADYMTEAPIQVFTRAVVVARRVRDALGDTRQPVQIARLNILGAVTQGLMASVCTDAGQPRYASMHAQAAWAYARAISHFGLMSWAKALAATAAFWDGRGGDAVMAYRQGLETRPSGADAMRLHSIGARGHAVCGDLDGVRRALAAAEDAAGDDSGSALDEFGGALAWTPIRQELCASAALLQVAMLRGDLDRAVLEDIIEEIVERAARFANLAEEHPGQVAVSTRMAALLDTATARILRGDLNGAELALAPVLELPPELRKERLVIRFQQLSRRLPDHADDLLGVIGEWTRETTRTLAVRRMELTAGEN